MQILANSLQVAAQAVGSKADDDACNGSDGLFGWSIVCTYSSAPFVHLGLAGVVHAVCSLHDAVAAASTYSYLLGKTNPAAI